MIEIEDFIAGYVDRPFAWGQDDCSLFLADWWQENYGIDPAAHLRGTYSTEEEKAEIVRKSGSLAFLVSEICSSVGAREILHKSEIGRGDFGIISPGVGGLYTGEFWASRALTGVVFTKGARVWRAWSING